MTGLVSVFEIFIHVICIIAVFNLQCFGERSATIFFGKEDSTDIVIKHRSTVINDSD